MAAIIPSKHGLFVVEKFTPANPWRDPAELCGGVLWTEHAIDKNTKNIILNILASKLLCFSIHKYILDKTIL
jgi:hypothetical protein